MQQCFSQEKTITGSIKDTRSNPVGFANIMVYTPDSSVGIITYCFSDEVGNFSFNIKKSIPVIRLIISSVNYATQSIVIQVDTTSLLNIKLEDDTKTLAEVIIKAQNAGDTLKLATEKMNLTDQSTLRDILNKTEGMMVSKSGAISFNGKQITKVLINNKEVFVNQNKIALDNLNYEIMDNVQVINNYKDRFNIDFNSLSAPVINIKTKSKFKGVYKFSAEAAAGYKNAYQLKGKGFLFSDHFNSFLTSNTNNVSEKDLSFDDVAAPFLQQSSDLFRNTLLPFFNNDDFLQYNFNSNNSFTLRKQTQNTKLGLVTYYARMNTRRSSVSTITSPENTIKEEAYSLNEKGNMFSNVLNFSHLFSRKTVLHNNTIMGWLSQSSYSQNNASIFFPEKTQLQELNSSAPASFALANATQLTSLISPKMLFNINATYFTEATRNYFQTGLVTTSNININQHSTLNLQKITTSANIEYKHNRLLSVKGGLGYTGSNEKASMDYSAPSRYSKDINRIIHAYNGLIEIDGRTSKLEYALAYTPKHYIIPFEAKISSRAVYNNASATVGYAVNYLHHFQLKYNSNSFLYDLNSSYDTTIQSYNFRTINADINKYTISQTSNIEAGYHYSNIAKAKAAYITYNYQTDRNTIQSIYDTAVNNIFFYRNIVVDRKRSSTFSAGLSKGFYITKQYHKLDIGGNLSYTNDAFPTIVNHQTQQYQIQKIAGNIELGFIPQSFFIKEITLGSKLSYQHLLLDGDLINKQSDINHYISFSSSNKKTDWKLTLEETWFKSAGISFHVPNCNFSVRYKQSEKLSFGLNGKSIFNVIGLNHNPNTSLSTYSEGNLITQTINTYRIGYILLNIIYKF